MEGDAIDLQNPISMSNIGDQALSQSVGAPTPLNSQMAEPMTSSSRPLTVRTHVSDAAATTHGINSCDDSCWGWLQPAPECSKYALPHVMLRGSVIGIGRVADAFDLAMRRQVPEPLQNAGRSDDGSGPLLPFINSMMGSIFPATAPGSTDEAIFGTGEGELAQVPGLFVEIPDGRISRVHCLLYTTTITTTAAADDSNKSFSLSSSSSLPTLRDISRNGTFLNGRKISRGEEAPLIDGDRISLVLSVAPLSEQAFIFHLGHPLAALLEGPPPAQWIGWKGCSFSGERERTGVIIPGKEGICSSPTSPASLSSPSPKSFPPPLRSSSASSSFPSSPVPYSPSVSLTRVLSHTTALKRSATSLYTTPQAALAEPSTLHCQICLDTLNNAVALEPCGHSYCATCLSQHFGSCLEHGQALACPLRCSLPQRVVVNAAVRELVEELKLLQLEAEKKDALENERVVEEGTVKNEAASIEAAAAAAAAAACIMHPAAPLDDSRLPLSLSSLKDDKLVSILASISHSTALATTTSGSPSLDFNIGVAAAVEALELLARLCWSDKESRSIVSTHGGVETVVKCINAWIESEVALCSGCLALMALLRGDSPGSSANRWQLGTCGGLEMLIQAMEIYKNQSMVQLSCLLCLVALALEGSYFQKEITKLGITTILSAMKRHMDCAEVVAKALLAVGALAQGGSADAIWIGDRIVAAGAVELIAMVLKKYEGLNEDVLWACVFVLAILARQKEEQVPSGSTIGGDNDGDGSHGEHDVLYENRGFIERILRMASAGVLPALRRAATQYRLNRIINDSNSYNDSDGVGGDNGQVIGQEDETILVAAAYLEQLLERASALIWLRRLRRATQAACAGVLLWMGYKSYVGRNSTKSGTHRTGNSRHTLSVFRRHFPWFRLSF